MRETGKGQQVAQLHDRYYDEFESKILHIPASPLKFKMVDREC